MRNILFDKDLSFEINVIGYKMKGESILFFLKADGKAVYAGLVDCYEEKSENIAIELLESEGLEFFDFVCWTHPHDDHTVGMEKVIEDYCSENTLFWMPPYLLEDIEKRSNAAQITYEKLFRFLKSENKIKMRVREASDSKTLEKLQCSGNASKNSILFEIKCFAPDSDLLGSLKVEERLDQGNIYSIGLLLNIGHYKIILAGDVEDDTINLVPDFNLDVQERVDYIKIPHHASKTASEFVKRLLNLNVVAPAVATTTVYRIHNLPEAVVLKKYRNWGTNVDVYSTGNMNKKDDVENNGIIQTKFDVLERKAIPIETYLYGNAIYVNDYI